MHKNIIKLSKIKHTSIDIASTFLGCTLIGVEKSLNLSLKLDNLSVDAELEVMAKFCCSLWPKRPHILLPFLLLIKAILAQKSGGGF